MKRSKDDVHQGSSCICEKQKQRKWDHYQTNTKSTRTTMKQLNKMLNKLINLCFYRILKRASPLLKDIL